MQAYLTLTRRELGGFFYSWIGYIVIAGAVFLTGLSFVILLRQLQGEPTALPITEVFLSLCYWLIVLFSAPIITMRLFALEKYSGTFETLMTAPVGDVAVVLAKFTAAIIFYMIMWLPLLACILVLRYFSRGSNLLDPGTLASTFLGIFLVGIFNRLAEEWRAKNPGVTNLKRATALIALLKESVFGIDLSETACRIASIRT